MTSRERMRRALTGESLPDRVPVCEICFWPETIERWRREGLPADADPIGLLQMDPIHSVGLDCSLRLPVEVVEEDERMKVTRNADGVLNREWKDHTATPLDIGHTIQTPDDWVQYRDRLAFAPERIPQDYADAHRKAMEQDAWFTVSPAEPIWWVLMTVGFERTFEWLMDEPDVVAEMVAYQARLSLELLEAVCRIAKPDALWYFSDLCYKNGLLFSPTLYNEIVLPQIRKVTEACHERGIVTMYHCCGDQRPVLPLLIAGGFDCAQPMEARTGCDVRALKPVYGNTITFMGNISVERLSTTLEELEEEVTTKVAAASAGGRYVFHSDHSVPPTVPWSHYQRAVELAKQVGTYD